MMEFFLWVGGLDSHLPLFEGVIMLLDNFSPGSCIVRYLVFRFAIPYSICIFVRNFSHFPKFQWNIAATST